MQHLHGLGLAAAVAVVAAAFPAKAGVPSLPVAWDDVAMPAGAPAARLHGDRVLALTIVLPSLDRAGAERMARAVSDTRDGRHGRFLAPAAFALRFGADPVALRSLLAWLSQSGLTVTSVGAAGTVVGVAGQVSAIEAAFGTTLWQVAGSDGELRLAARNAPLIPATLARSVLGVIGLSASLSGPSRAQSMSPAQSAARRSPPQAGYSAAQLRAAYGVPTGLVKAPGTIAIFALGGFDPGDIATYAAANGLGTPDVSVRGVDGWGGTVTDVGNELEAVGNIDMALAIDPAAHIQVYEQGTARYEVALLHALAAMADDDTAQVISISYGEVETTRHATQYAAESQIFTQMAAQGQTVVASSGDYGAYGTYDQPRKTLPYRVLDPASQPMVLGIGGTTLTLAETGARAVEQGWRFSGGGPSAIWPIPAWQKGPTEPTLMANGGSTSRRNVPDLSAVADPLTGVAVYSALNGGWLERGGTGISAPIWAGMLALGNAARADLGLGPMGLATPSLYFEFITGDSLVFSALPQYDVTTGYNGDPNDYPQFPGFFAGIGYDDVAGLGTINGASTLVDLILEYTSFYTSPLAPPAVGGLSVQPGSTDVHVAWSASPGATGYIVESAPGGGSTSTNVFPPTLIGLTPTTSLTLHGLQPNRGYVVGVLPVNTHGGSLTAVTQAGFATSK